jgi:hypothetical protein
MPMSRSAAVSRGFAANARCNACGNESVREGSCAATGTDRITSAQAARRTVQQLDIIINLTTDFS